MSDNAGSQKRVRMNAQHFLLTYAQVNIERFNLSGLSEHFVSLLKRDVKDIVAIKVKHKNDGDHVHVPALYLAISITP